MSRFEERIITLLERIAVALEEDNRLTARALGGIDGNEKLAVAINEATALLVKREGDTDANP